jgi:hypothetical protein
MSVWVKTYSPATAPILDLQFELAIDLDRDSIGVIDGRHTSLAGAMPNWDDGATFRSPTTCDAD